MFVLALLAISSTARAQNNISEEKRKLIAEMVLILKMDEMIPQITDEALRGMESTFPTIFDRVVDSDQRLTKGQKDEIKAKQAESFRSFSVKFRDRMRTTIDYNKYVVETVYPLYDKFFSEQELRDLVQFYRTPTGQKTIASMPQLFAESQRLAQEKLLPQVLTIINQLVEEEFKNMVPEGPRKEIMQEVPVKRRKTDK